MSEYASENDFLESIIKIEPEEFEKLDQKAAGASLENITDRVEPSALDVIESVAVNSADSEESHRESAETLARKGNEGKGCNDPHSCCICRKVVSSRPTLKLHLERFHLKTNQIVCDLCAKIVFTRDAMIRHLRLNHGEEKFTCNQCDYKSGRKSALESHKLSHAAKTECPICSKKVTFLKNHMRDHKTKVSCQICHKPFPQRCMEKHLRTHRNRKCGDCEETFESNEDLRRHKLRSHHEGKLFECYCGSVFPVKSSLKEHQRSHNEEKETCDVCQKHFSLKTNLKRHRKKQHGLVSLPEEKAIKVLNTSGPFICDNCGTKLSSRESFQHHCFVHRNPKMFCDLCPRSFHQKSRLARHITRDHLKLRPFQCDICKHKASSRGNLELHKQRHGSKKKCQACNKPVANMKEHLKNHVKAECTICGKMYSKVYLNQHLKTHTKTR